MRDKYDFKKYTPDRLTGEDTRFLAMKAELCAIVRKQELVTQFSLKAKASNVSKLICQFVVSSALCPL